MLYRLYAIFIKESQILLRDKAGLTVLYLMPLALVFLMVFIQDRTFNELKEVEIPLVFASDDRGMVGNALKQTLRANRLFRFSQVDDSVSQAADFIKEQVAKGTFKAGVYVPAELTAQTRELLLSKAPLSTSAIQLQLYFDPAVKQSLQQLVQSAIRETIARTETRLLFMNMQEQVSAFGPQAAALITLPDSAALSGSAIPVKKAYVSRNKTAIVPNSVQHNIPSWSLFAMFFIVIPLAGSLIQERDEGTFKRLQALPVRYGELLAGKTAVYFLVCWSQFLIMLSIGVYIMPLLGLPALQTGSHSGALALMVTVTALAAVGYGLMVGSVARTQQQASSFGSISVIIAAAVGGIWVPVFIMPEFMQTISLLSPLNWALNGFQEIFLRGGAIQDIVQYVLALALFFLFTLIVPLLKFRLRNH